jgi:hypothetical protein
MRVTDTVTDFNTTEGDVEEVKPLEPETNEDEQWKQSLRRRCGRTGGSQTPMRLRSSGDTQSHKPSLRIPVPAPAPVVLSASSDVAAVRDLLEDAVGRAH